MYLKSLTALGFKSFADKTTLHFQPGMTTIVGPNGCGKSNVADAVRWVLGEQSAKALRGSGMQDVIFSGTDRRKAMGMAEVSLTIGNVDEEHLQAAGVEISYNEVTVTRRVYRDGGSEYFINKVSCRLKDIQQLFMGTGVGRASYSIMAQGNITQILSSKPEERRIVFEEAAGITKFKAQKREALRKLEHTEQNLLRVSDLIREVKRQIGSLQRQAGKARRYKKIQSELEHLDTQLARHKYDLLQSGIYDRSQELNKLREEIERCSSSVLQGENEIGQMRERLAQLDHQISQSQHRGLELKGEMERHEGRIAFNQERIQELETQNSKALNDISQAEERRIAAEQELSGVNERLEAGVAAVEAKKQALEARRAALSGIENDLREKQEALRNLQADSFQLAQTLSRSRNEINALNLQSQGNVVRQEKLSSEKIQLEEERSRLEERLKEFFESVESEKQDVASRRGTVAERQQRLQDLQQELSESAGALDDLMRTQAELRSRLGVLVQLEEAYEGFSPGTQAALQQSDAVLGSLAQKIRVPDDFVKPIEAVLGQRLQLVLTQQRESAREVLDELTANELGRASIAVLDLLGGEGGVADEGTFAGVEGVQPVLALSVVEAEPGVLPLLRGLLGRTWMVPDLDAATRAWEARPREFDFVTAKGDLLDRFGIYTGGFSNGKDQGAASILARKNQIAELGRQLGDLQEKIGEASRRKGTLQSEQTELQAGLQEAQSELRKQEVQVATREGEYNILQNSLRVLHQKIDTVVYEIRSLGEQDKDAKEKREQMASELGDLEKQEREVLRQVEEWNREVESFRQKREEANTELTGAMVALATEEQMCQSVRNQQRPLEERIAELKQMVEQRRGEMSSFTDRRSQAESEIAASQQKIETLRHERDQVGVRTADLEGQRKQQEGEIGGREVALRGFRETLAKSQERRGELDIELTQKKMAVENLVERIQQRYQVALEEVRSECITITYADEGQARVETLSPEEMREQGASTDWDAVAEQVKALQEKIEKIGPVNLVAIDEYEETEQRFEFLSQQHDDLVQAKDQLFEAINRINRQTKEMFMETFRRIRENFQAMFAEVFNGGKADLTLVDEQNVLESGIDIVARPPGKKLQGISLLSGGEQTMTAVALLFAIYQVKPSPFCVLDELDAPLDESNINRFTRILKRFLEHSQFIIITHNKRTISMADVLYGVTMQEHGVSRIVSMKFHKEGENGNGHGAPIEQPVTNGSNGNRTTEEAASEVAVSN